MWIKHQGNWPKCSVCRWWKYINQLEINLRPHPGPILLRKHILVMREDSSCCLFIWYILSLNKQLWFVISITLPGLPITYHINSVNLIYTYRWSATYDGSTYHFSTLWWCESNTYLVETVLWILNLDLFPWLVIYGTILFHDAGQWQWATTPFSHTITRWTTNALITILYP